MESIIASKALFPISLLAKENAPTQGYEMLTLPQYPGPSREAECSLLPPANQQPNSVPAPYGLDSECSRLAEAVFSLVNKVAKMLPPQVSEANNVRLKTKTDSLI